MKHGLMALATCLLGLSAAPALSATISAETTTDVGDQLNTAYVVNSFSSGDVISGSLTADAFNADLFKVNLTAGDSFTATVSNRFFDTQLFLFDSLGNGLTGNDNSSEIDLNAAFTYTASTTGMYYLAISGSDFDPIDSSGNPIFSNDKTGTFAVTSNAALFSWIEQDGFDPSSGNYALTLSLSAAAAVPEPSVLPGLIGLAGGLGLAMFKRKSLA